MKLMIIIVFFGFFFMISLAYASEIGFIEKFSLSDDRSEALKQLIPGTGDYYYYSCLNAQHNGDYGKLREILELWIKRDGYTDQIKEILNRQALLQYEKAPEKSLGHIRRELNLLFDHTKEIADKKTDYPSMLDENFLNVDRLTQQAFSNYDNLEGIEETGLDFLDHGSLNPNQLRHFLQRIRIPDIPDLPALVVKDLKYKHSGGFGSHNIHKLMTKSQLEQCLKLMPELIDNTAFINSWLASLAPPDGVDLQYNLAEKKAYLDRMWGFVKTLAPAHNSLKTHILYHILDLNRKTGNYNHDLFMTYIQLPRSVSYINPSYLDKKEFYQAVAELNADFSAVTRMPVIGNDEELVRDYLAFFLIDAPDYKAYVSYIRDTYLQDVFVETKILNGIGDMEQWYSLMPPSRYQALKDRIDIDFALTNKKFFAPDENVSLDLFIKNVNTLIVKVFELNTFNYYQANLKEIDTAINLDGLIATWENVITYNSPPLLRSRRTFDFAQIKKTGVFVVEFIGNGKNSRALIRKGNLYVTEQIGAAGHEFVIRDEKNAKCPNAVIWMAGREYKPGEDGAIIIPFSTDPKRQTIILKNGDFCSLASFDHLSENYELTAGFYIDREALLKRCSANIIVRPLLSLNGHPVSIALLKNVRLVVESVDIEGISSTKEVLNFEIFEDKESVFKFQVPESLSQIRFLLKAEVRSISKNDKVELADSADFSLNRIDTTLKTDDVFLRGVDGAYVLEHRGKNGEINSGRPINFEFKHRFFTNTLNTTLQTDDNGRIYLGALSEIEWIQAVSPDGTSRLWNISEKNFRYPGNIHDQAGKTIRIPYLIEDRIKTKSAIKRYALIEKCGNAYTALRQDRIEMRDGALEIKGLDAGNYELFLKDAEEKITLRLAKGDVEDGFVLSDSRILEKKNSIPLFIKDISVDNNSIKIRMENISEFSRLHVIATCFIPEFSMFSNLVYTGLPEPYEIRLGHTESLYLAGRNIGDEYRYILERKYAEKFPGNMLNRPEVLLNPWNIRKTETAEDKAHAGDMFEQKVSAKTAARSEYAKEDKPIASAESFSNMDFLAEPSVIFVNLKPDKDGVVIINKKDLGMRQQIHFIAVDPFNTHYRKISMPEAGIKTRELRMVQTFDPQKHFTEQKRISVFETGQAFRLSDITTSDFETYDSLEKVYRLFSTLNNDANFQKFGFILRWLEMDQEKKQETYSEYACHELNFFIFHKDRQFFDSVILPYLKNKKDKTFMDHWLIGDDLSEYLKPWAFSKLNIVEKILLAGKDTDDKGRIKRHVKELFDLIQPDIDTYNRLFDTALKGKSLDEDSYGITGAADVAARDMVFALSAKEAEADEEVIMDALPSAAAPSPPMFQRSKGSEEKAARRSLLGKMTMKNEVMARMAPPREAEREMTRQFFRAPDKTEEWVENNYYKLPIESQNAELITINAFWNDYAAKDSNKLFLSTNFPYASRNFTEMMLALSVLDLPFKSKTHPSEITGIEFKLTAQTPMIVFHKELRESSPEDGKTPILVSQDFFRSDDPYEFIDNERMDKFVKDEFLFQTPYGCQVVLSNPTSSRRKLRALLQIPHGAMPLSKGFYSKSVPVTLEPYTTQRFEYHFYFPAPGTYGLYPAQVAKDEIFIAGAEISTFKVVERFSRSDTESWDYVSQNGSEDQVLQFMQTHNLNRLNLDKIAFRMQDKAFFEKTIELLKNRHFYHHTLWSYSIHHNMAKYIPEFLKHSEYANHCGMYIDTKLLTLDPVARGTYEHREYKPLINARAHQLGKDRKILNNRFYEQYHRFMKYLSYRSSLDDADLMATVYYMLLQDRVSEAIGFFNRIKNPAPVIQYDYMRTYIDFYTGNLERAEKTAAQYAGYPVPRWSKFFQHAADQIAELKGSQTRTPLPPKGGDERGVGDQIQAKLASTEPSFDFSIESHQVTLTYQNVTSCHVNYYPMDIELLFSRNPFVRKDAGDFSFIQPNESVKFDLPVDGSHYKFELPEKFHNSNLVVEILSGGIKKSQVYYANSLDVQIIETYGQVKVSHISDRKPLTGTYVKVFAKMKDGSAANFYKDGYTDFRGKFDYASLSTDELNRVEKFAILILNDQYGAVIREAEAPKR